MNFSCPAVAVDVICYHIPSGKIALIERKYPPLGYALPGGFIDVGETVEEAARREMREELNVDLLSLVFVNYFDDPHRDPRKHVISFAFFATIWDEPKAGDDAKTVTLMNVQDVLQSKKLCFDHENILSEAISQHFL